MFAGTTSPIYAAVQVASQLTQNKSISDAAKTSPTSANAKALEESNARTKAMTDAALAKFPDNVPLQVLGAASSGQLGDTKAAATRAQHAVEMGEAQLGTAGAGPGAAEKRQNLSNALTMHAAVAAQLGGKDAAMQDLARALKLDPNNEAALKISKLIQGHQFHDIPIKIPTTADPSKAMQMPDADVTAEMRAALIRQVVNRPEGFSASVGFTQRAETSLQLDDFQRMRDNATAALAKLPDNPKALMQRAFAALMLKDYQQAIIDATAGLKLRPDAASLLVTRATAYNATGRPREALGDAVAAVKSDPSMAYAWLQKGLAREKLAEGNDQYLGDIKVAADLDPALGPEYQEALARRAQGGKPTNDSQGTAAAGSPGFMGGLKDLASRIEPHHLYIFSAGLLGFTALILVFARRRED